MKKRVLAFLLTVLILTTVFPLSALAAYENTAEVQPISASCVNPLYEDVISKNDLIKAEYHANTHYTGRTYHKTAAAAGAELRPYLEKRVGNVTVGYYFPIEKFTNEGLTEIVNGIIGAAHAHTGVSSQGDYLMWTYAGWYAEASYVSMQGDYYQCDINLTITYYTTYEQEAMVTKQVAVILDSLNPTGSDYQKIKTVYDWICDNVTYDYANLNDDSYNLKYTAYAALIDRTAVCQGYALLFYRFALEMGIDSRIIVGEGGGGRHAWNIVKIGKFYYNLDSTWDAGSYSYNYFLKCPDNFYDHYRDYEYTTDSFNTKYPMGKADYSTSVVEIVTQPKSVTVADGAKATVKVEATGDGLEYYWYFKNPGASKFTYTSSFTGNTYSVALSKERSGRQVYCYVVDKYGNSVKSDTVTLTVGNVAKITTQPKSVTVADGAKATVTVKATGDGLKYYWYFKNPGASKFSYTSTFTGNTYTVNLSKDRSGRQVYCYVVDKYGNSVKSDTVTLTVGNVAKITTQPKSVMVADGAKATVTVKATGDGLKYYWYFKNPGASKFTYTSSFTGNTYSVALAKERSGRQVYCYVVDKYGNSVKSDTVTLTVGNVAKITTQPKSVMVADGAKATVTVKATGDGLKYYWYFKNPGASKFSYTSTFTGNTYTVNLSKDRSGRQVYCYVVDKYGNSVKSDTVTLTVGNKVKITTQPKNAMAAKGASARTTVYATGDGLTYEWWAKDVGDTKFYKSTAYKTATYSIVMESYRNGRQVYCVVRDKYGNSVKTNTVTLNVGNAAKITTQPKNVTVAAGAKATVKVTATGDGLTYKWYFKNPGATKFSYTSTFTGNTYSVALAKERSGRQVYCVVTDKYGNSVKSNTVTLYTK